MNAFKTLPGTNIPCDRGEESRRMLESLFSAGGLVLSQVSALTGLKGYMVQNWVSRGYLTPPQNKKYDQEQFCRIVTINLLKDSLSITEITDLLSHINGRLDDKSDDLIDDADLYICFVDTLRMWDGATEHLDDAVEGTLEKLKESGEKKYSLKVLKLLEEVLPVMCVAYHSSRILQTAKAMVAELPQKK